MANTAALADRGTLYDAIDVFTGSLSVDPASLLDLVFNSAGSTIDWSDTFWAVQHSWLLIDASSAGTSTGIFSLGSVGTDSTGAVLASIRPNATFSVARNGSNLLVEYGVVAVPEPGTISLAAIGAAVAVFGALRQRKSRSRR